VVPIKSLHQQSPKKFKKWAKQYVKLKTLWCQGETRPLFLIKTMAKISKSTLWFFAGVGVLLLSALALYLPGHNFHGGILTGVNLLLFNFGPIFLFTIGLLKGLPKNKINGWCWRGLALNLLGLFFHFLTLAGILNWLVWIDVLLPN
jgi:hypothetical protein